MQKYQTDDQRKVIYEGKRPKRDLQKVIYEGKLRKGDVQKVRVPAFPVKHASGAHGPRSDQGCLRQGSAPGQVGEEAVQREGLLRWVCFRLVCKCFAESDANHDKKTRNNFNNNSSNIYDSSSKFLSGKIIFKLKSNFFSFIISEVFKPISIDLTVFAK